MFLSFCHRCESLQLSKKGGNSSIMTKDYYICNFKNFHKFLDFSGKSCIFVGFLYSNTGGHIYVRMNDNGTAFSFTDHFMRTSFYFDDRKNDRLGDKLGDELGDKLGNGLGDKRSELSYNRRRILELMEIDGRISIPKIADTLGLSATAIEKNIDYLKENGFLNRIGNAKAGYWEVIE